MSSCSCTFPSSCTQKKSNKVEKLESRKKPEPAASLWGGRGKEGAKGANRQKYIIYSFHYQYSAAVRAREFQPPSTRATATSALVGTVSALGRGGTHSPAMPSSWHKPASVRRKQRSEAYSQSWGQSRATGSRRLASQAPPESSQAGSSSHRREQDSEDDSASLRTAASHRCSLQTEPTIIPSKAESHFLPFPSTGSSVGATQVLPHKAILAFHAVEVIK